MGRRHAPHPVAGAREAAGPGPARHRTAAGDDGGVAVAGAPDGPRRRPRACRPHRTPTPPSTRSSTLLADPEHVRHAAGGRARTRRSSCCSGSPKAPGRHRRAGRPGGAGRGRGLPGRLAARPRPARCARPAHRGAAARGRLASARGPRVRAGGVGAPAAETGRTTRRRSTARTSTVPRPAQADACVRLVEDLLEAWSVDPPAGAQVGRPRACATCAARRPGSTSRSGRRPCWSRPRTPPACSAPAVRSTPSGSRRRRTTGGAPTASPTAGWAGRAAGWPAHGWPGWWAAGTTARRSSPRSGPTSSAGSPCRCAPSSCGCSPPCHPGRWSRADRLDAALAWVRPRQSWGLRSALVGLDAARGRDARASPAPERCPARAGRSPPTPAVRRATPVTRRRPTSWRGRTASPTRWPRCCREPVDHVLLQADLTAVAPGPLVPSLARALAIAADVESTGGATVYRFTPGVRTARAGRRPDRRRPARAARHALAHAGAAAADLPGRRPRQTARADPGRRGRGVRALRRHRRARRAGRAGRLPRCRPAAASDRADGAVLARVSRRAARPAPRARVRPRRRVRRTGR